MIIKNSKLIIAALLLTLLAAPINALAKPSENQIKGWIASKKVLFAKRKLFPDKYEELDLSKISKVKTVSKSQDDGLTSSTALIRVTFDYDYDRLVKCEASITYEWPTFRSNYQLQNVIATCDQ